MNTLKTKLIQFLHGKAGEVVRWVISAILGTLTTFLVDQFGIKIPDDVIAQINLGMCAAVLFVINHFMQVYQAKQAQAVQTAINTQLPAGEKLVVDGWIGPETMRVVKAIPVED